MDGIIAPKIGDHVIFTAAGAKWGWKTECTVTQVSDPKIVADPWYWMFSGETDTGRRVGGYVFQIIETVQVPQGT